MRHVIIFFILFWACPAWGGTLETSFCPGIPADIQFGDSPERVIELMGRSSYDGNCNQGQSGWDETCVLAFNLDPFETLHRDLLYVFMGRKFDHVVYRHMRLIHDDLSNTPLHQAVPTWEKLERLYGTPDVVTQRGPEPRRELYEMLVWERPNSAIISVPFIGTVDADILVENFVMVPLDPSGRYSRFTAELAKLKEKFENHTRLDDTDDWDTSFCPDIPPLRFGDQASEIIEWMGRPPDRSKCFENDRCSYIYILPTDGGLVATVAYNFQKELLHHTSLGYVYEPSEDFQGEFFRRSAVTPPRLEELYGQPTKTMVKQYSGPDHQAYQISIWERPNNAVIYMPPLYLKNKSITAHILVCPLDPSGDYDPGRERIKCFENGVSIA